MIHAINPENGILTLDIGGEVRSVVVNMRTAFKVSLLDKRQEDKTLMFAHTLYAGLLQHPGNNLPEGFSLETAFEWMSDLEPEEIETVLAFGGKAMGFLTEGLIKTLTDKEVQNNILEAQLLKVPSRPGTA